MFEDDIDKTEWINAIADYFSDQEILRIDGFDNAVIGWTDSWVNGNRPVRLIYDAESVIEILINQQDLTEEEAWEYYSLNIIGSYMGEGTPIFMNREI